MPIRNVKKWSRYVKRSVRHPFTIRFGRQKNRLRFLKSQGIKGKESIKQAREKIRLLNARTKKRIKTKIMADTAISEFGLKHHLSAINMRVMRKLTEEFIESQAWRQEVDEKSALGILFIFQEQFGKKIGATKAEKYVRFLNDLYSILRETEGV